MKTICLYFQVHQPFRFKRYRFFNIGQDHYYYDDYTNEYILRKVADKSYLKTNKLLLELIREYGCKFRITFSVTGVAIEQFKLYAPEVIDSFKELADTGCVEFLAETYSHSLASLKDDREFEKQVLAHRQIIQDTFGQNPRVFRNTELIYSDSIGSKISDLGFEGMLTEGAKHVLGWKSPNFLYCNAINPRLKVLLRNYELSDDIAFRFSNKSWHEYPLSAQKYIRWIKTGNAKEELINIFMDYETFGEHQWEDTGIFDFLKDLPNEVFKAGGIEFRTPSQVIDELQPISAVNVPNPVSWADEEKDLTAWLGNDLQYEAFNKLYALADLVNKVNNAHIQKDWSYLQISDHFYYMSTKILSDGEVHRYFTPYDSPYDAFINYMNILSDFELKLKTLHPQSSRDFEIASLMNLVAQQEELIDKYQKELQALKLRKTKNVLPKKTKAKKESNAKARSASETKTSSKEQKQNKKSKSRNTKISKKV
jgi:alpha-amylase